MGDLGIRGLSSTLLGCVYLLQGTCKNNNDKFFKLSPRIELVVEFHFSPSSGIICRIVIEGQDFELYILGFEALTRF